MDEITFKHESIMGTPLGEVFTVIINTDADECEIYGTITVEDRYGTLCIYNQEQEDPEAIKRKGSLGLINDTRAISGYCKFTVIFDLKDKKNGDAQFISNSFDWDEETGYDKCLFAEVLGEHGTANVYYAVYSVALEANIWAAFVKPEHASSDVEPLKKKKKTSDVNVCGSIVARYKKRYDRPKSEVPKEYYEITMFECTSCELEDQDLIPLYRPVVVVPAFTSLLIEVDLTDCENGKPLWKGEVEIFPGDIQGGWINLHIGGTGGVIQVKATGFYYIASLEDVQLVKEGLRGIGRLY